jgi:hypothetical protein
MDDVLLQDAFVLSVKSYLTKKYSGWLCFYHFGLHYNNQQLRAKIEFLTIWSSLKVTHMFVFKGTQPSDINHIYLLAMSAISCASLAIGVVLH